MCRYQFQSTGFRDARRGTHLIDHVDEGLGVAPLEATDNGDLISTREDRLDQGGKVACGERASDQTFTCLSIERDE